MANQNLRIYGQKSSLDELITSFPTVTVANDESQPEAHPGEFLGSLSIPDDVYEDVNRAMPTLGLSCDDFPSW